VNWGSRIDEDRRIEGKARATRGFFGAGTIVQARVRLGAEHDGRALPNFVKMFRNGKDIGTGREKREKKCRLP